MSDEKESTYEPVPEVPEELRPKVQAILDVMAGKLTEKAAAEQLGLSRHYFQTLKNRGLKALISELESKPRGRPKKPSKEAELEKELERLRKENAQLQKRVDNVDQLLEVAADVMRGRLAATGRQTKAKATEAPSEPPKDEPDGARAALERARTLRRLGVKTSLSAALVGHAPSTLRRYARRERLGTTLVRRRGPAPGSPVTAAIIAHGREVVRRTRGLIGAAALSHAVLGLSRRQAAALKASELTVIERERVARSIRVHVKGADVIRGFDAMHVAGRYVLVAAEASVPYRTTIVAAPRYDDDHVLDALVEDMESHGPPLVYRLDRAACHRTDRVRAELSRRGVLMLHGPARHPCFYGQLERQNREHRAWLRVAGLPVDADLDEELRVMGRALNGLLPRRALGWRTAEVAWRQQRQTWSAAERGELISEVQDRAARIQRHLGSRGGAADTAQRLAIEAALQQRGWLKLETGGWC